MARLSYEYKYYQHSKLATAISKYCNLFGMLFGICGLLLTVLGALSVIISGFTHGQSWLALAVGVVLLALAFALINLGDKWAARVAKKKLEKLLLNQYQSK